MATSITTKIAKEKLIKARCGEKSLPKVMKMALEKVELMKLMSL